MRTIVEVFLTVQAYLAVTALFGWQHYHHYNWKTEHVSSWDRSRGATPENLYNSREARAFFSALTGLLWPLSWVLLVILSRNSTTFDRNRQLVGREQRVAKMERELGL